MEKLPPICPTCQHYNYCETPCHQINMLADGNKPLREVLREVRFDLFKLTDYKEVLIEQQENLRLKRVYKKEDIDRLTCSPQVKIIGYALTQGFKIINIATTLRISRTMIYKIIREHKLGLHSKQDDSLEDS